MANKAHLFVLRKCDLLNLIIFLAVVYYLLQASPNKKSVVPTCALYLSVTDLRFIVYQNIPLNSQGARHSF